MFSICWIQELSCGYYQGKERPFFTLGGANDSLHKANLDQKTEGPELNGILDVLENFKPIKDNKDTVSLNPEESQTQYSTTTTTHVTQESQIQDLTKSRNAFGGLSSIHCFIFFSHLVNNKSPF